MHELCGGHKYAQFGLHAVVVDEGAEGVLKVAGAGQWVILTWCHVGGGMEWALDCPRPSGACESVLPQVGTGWHRWQGQ